MNKFNNMYFSNDNNIIDEKVWLKLQIIGYRIIT